MSVEGVLPIWKPEGFTSHDVVAVARRSLKLKRIGHTGTLDPMVTGVLPLCIGRSTRLVEYIQELPKQYVAELTLGIATTTEDWTGTITDQVENIQVDHQSIVETLQSFIGEIEQVPPMYSAIKQNGVKLYDLARQGIEVERKSRKVMIYNIELVDVDLHPNNPTVRFRVDCSKGTYIRTLCVDIGKKLGYPAMMSKLVRTSTGSFSEKDCISIEQLRVFLEDESLQKYLVQEDVALHHFARVQVPDWAAIRMVNGLSIHRSRLPETCYLDATTSIFRVYDEQDRFVGLFQFDEQTGNMIANKVFATPEQLNSKE